MWMEVWDLWTLASEIRDLMLTNANGSERDPRSDVILCTGRTRCKYSGRFNWTHLIWSIHVQWHLWNSADGQFTCNYWVVNKLNSKQIVIFVYYVQLRKLRVQILVGDRGSWDLFLDIKLCFFGNFFIFACDRVLLHPTETLFWMCTRRLEIRDFFPFCVHIPGPWAQEGNCATSIKNNQKYTV